MPIYTKTGDKGTSGLFGGKRLAKSALIFEVLGTLDELNALLGVCLNFSLKKSLITKILDGLQNDLFQLGALIANEKSTKKDYLFLERKVAQAEESINFLEKTLPPLKNFILPGGTELASFLHVSRAGCRCLERNFVKYYSHSKSPAKMDFVLKYINRLSDLLFMLARYANFEKKINDVIWRNTL